LKELLTAFCDEMCKLADVRQFKTIKEMEGSLKKGDIILTSIRDPYSPLKRVVHLGNPSRWHHTSFYLGDDRVVDTWAKGVHETSLKASIAGGPEHGDPAGKGLDVLVVRPKATVKQKREAVETAKAYVGKPYSTSGFLGAILPPRQGRLSREERRSAPKGVICSQVVARAYPDIEFSKKHPDWTLPEDLASSSKVRVVGEYSKRK
jgi:uncharacterized protein YycO